MPSFRSLFAAFFKKVDLFEHNNLLRYNGESEYTTVTGGLVSIAVIVLYVILFASMGLKTVQK